ncbi:serine hydrolase [Streptomyces mirabilis]|uniref:serine hydrolase n=1 Tax=Streptomyces mirabilis TaxID=68239 RepID=UPI0036827D69
MTKVFTCTALVKTLRDNSIPLGTGSRESVGSTALAALGDGPRALPEAAELVVGTGNEHEPGARWSSYNGNYILAGAVLAAFSGTSYERAALEETLLGPWNGLRSRMGARPFRPGHRAAMLLIPDEDHVSVAVTNQQHALRATARFLSDMQHPMTNDDLATAIDRFAA